MQNKTNRESQNDHYESGYEKLKAALKAYDEERISDFFLNQNDEKPIPMTDRGKENMRELFTQFMGAEKANEVIEKEEQYYRQKVERWKARRRRRIKKGVAAAGIAVCVVAGVSTAAVAFNLPENIYRALNKDTYTKVNVDVPVDTSGHDYIEQEYVLSECIEGYELVDRIVLDNLIYSMYQMDDEKCYTFTQRLEQFNMNLNTEDTIMEIIDTMYGQATYYSNKGLNTLVWSYNGYYFGIAGTLTLDELTFLQESLKKGEEHQ